MTKIKYLQHPSFTAAEWSQRNPLLKSGEIGFELDEFTKATRYKVGPGLWNDLPYAGGDEYPYSEVPTNPIGDAKGVLQGKPSSEILHLMLNPFQNVAVSAVQNDADSRTPKGTQLFEIGQQLSGTVSVLYNVANNANLAPISPATKPITVISNNGIFTNEGEFDYGTAIMSLDGILKPDTQESNIITVEASDSEGAKSSGITKIDFSPRIQWGTSGGDTIDSILSGDAVPKVILSAQKFAVTSSYKRTYDITNVGYTWLVIPEMLGPNNITFTDVTDPNAPAGYAMQDMGARNIDTSVGQYQCRFYRSVFYLQSNGILKAS